MFHCVPQQRPHGALAPGWTSANLNPGPAQGRPAADLPPHARQAGPAKESILAIYPRKTRCLLRLITAKLRAARRRVQGLQSIPPTPRSRSVRPAMANTIAPACSTGPTFRPPDSNPVRPPPPPPTNKLRTSPSAAGRAAASPAHAQHLRPYPCMNFCGRVSG